jgi:hypothetical protein
MIFQWVEQQIQIFVGFDSLFLFWLGRAINHKILNIIRKHDMVARKICQHWVFSLLNLESMNLLMGIVASGCSEKSSCIRLHPQELTFRGPDHEIIDCSRPDFEGNGRLQSQEQTVSPFVIFPWRLSPPCDALSKDLKREKTWNAADGI